MSEVQRGLRIAAICVTAALLMATPRAEQHGPEYERHLHSLEEQTLRAVECAQRWHAHAIAAERRARALEMDSAPADGGVRARVIVSAEFTDTPGDDVEGKWPASSLPDSFGAKDVVFECQECLSCPTLRWSLWELGFAPSSIDEIARWLSTVPEIPEDAFPDWGVRCVGCPDVSCEPSYSVLLRWTGAAYSSISLVAHYESNRSDAWDLRGPAEADGAEGNYCRLGLVGGWGEQRTTYGEWFSISLIDPKPIQPPSR